MIEHLSPLDQALLDGFQRDFPLRPRPYAAMAQNVDTTEADTIDRLRVLQAAGMISRIGATVRPNTVGASTLAALSVPAARIEAVAELVNTEHGVNHSYLREHDWNLWFVATAPDAKSLAACLARIKASTGLTVLDLPLRRAFNIDLGFSLNGAKVRTPVAKPLDLSVLCDADRPIIQALSDGLALVARPFNALADQLSRTEADVIARIKALSDAGILTRVGVIVRHRTIGWHSNAMVVWDVPENQITAAGTALARHPGVTLCYERQRLAGLWDYPLFSMIHGQSRAQALAVLNGALALPELAGCAHQVLFSQRCFKQKGAVVHQKEAVA
ncbi:MAG: Lrp/AsnC family transcriptional regulator [Amylibacter sp.]|nr:Lrp/AsnC family transcriptional regulator [Amylibacter sp.]